MGTKKTKKYRIFSWDFSDPYGTMHKERVGVSSVGGKKKYGLGATWWFIEGSFNIQTSVRLLKC
jgi:hypothetical protein